MADLINQTPSKEKKGAFDNDKAEKGDFEDYETTPVQLENAPPGPKVDYSGVAAKTDPVEIKLVRKLDKYIMTSLWSMYWLNYLDRNAIALARLNNLEEDLGLSDTQYQTCVSILFVGYILGGIPSNMLITRIRPSVYLSICMCAWAVVSGLTAVCNDYIGLLLVRFFLGIAESPYYAGALYLLSIFYTRKEIATRIAILYTGNILATAFAGLIAAGIFELDGVHGISGWRWLFIIQGAVTFVRRVVTTRKAVPNISRVIKTGVAIVAGWFLPDRPLDTRWLSPAERQLAHDRIQRDLIGQEEKGSTMAGLKQACTDYRVWLFMFIQTMHLAANGFKNFFPTVVNSLGFNRTITLVLTCPPYLVAAVISVLFSASSGHFNERTWHIFGSKCVAVLGFALAAGTLNTGGRYFAMCLFTAGTYGVNSLVLGWVGTVCSQTPEKRAIAIAMVTTASNTSFIWTPYLFIKTSAPRYVPAMAASAAFSLCCSFGAFAMKAILKKQNKQLREKSGNLVVYPY